MKKIFFVTIFILSGLNAVYAQQASDTAKETIQEFKEIGLTFKEVERPNGYLGTFVSGEIPGNPELGSDRRLYSVNGLFTRSLQDIEDALAPAKAGQSIEVIVTDKVLSRRDIASVVLTDAPKTDVPDKPVPLLKRPDAYYIDVQRQLRQDALDGGYVYKNDAYWWQYPGYHVRYVFEGGHHKWLSPYYAREVLLRTYAELVDETCPSRLGKNPETVTLQMTETVTDDLGFTDSSTSTIMSIKVKQRLADPLRDVLTNLNDRTQVAPTLAGLQEAKDLLSFTRALHGEMHMLFAKEKCDSPVLDQFEENILRMTTKQPTIQKQPVAIPDAEAVTDDVYLPGTSDSVAVVCTAAASIERPKKHSYCICLDKAWDGRIPTAYRDMVTRDYNAFVKRVEWGQAPELQSLKPALASCKS